MEKIFECEKFTFAQKSNNSLMGVSFAVPGELITRFGADTNPFSPAKIEKSVHAGIAAGLTFSSD